MRILFILHSLANLAGIERVITDKMNYMAQQGHDVHLVTYEQGNHIMPYELHSSVRHTDLNCRYFTLYRYPLPQRLTKIWKMKRLFAQRLQQLVNEWHPDAVVVPSNVGDFMSEIMSLEGTKKIVESHCALPAFMMNSQWKEKLKNRMLLRAIFKCDLLIALTHNDQACWKHHLRKVLAVPNPVAFYCEPTDSSQQQPGRILAMGRYHAQKRFDRLVDAFSLICEKYPEWHIDIFGRGEDGEEEKLQEYINQKGLAGRVILNKPTLDVISEYKRSQMLAFSSDYEGFGLVLIEAMACGIPVVSTNCPFGPSEIIDNGVTGLLTKLDATDLANKMEWLMSHDKERAQMGQQAHIAAARFKKEVVMKQWEEAYLSIISNKQR